MGFQCLSNAVLSKNSIKFFPEGDSEACKHILIPLTITFQQELFFSFQVSIDSWSGASRSILLRDRQKNNDIKVVISRWNAGFKYIFWIQSEERFDSRFQERAAYVEKVMSCIRHSAFELRF